MICLYFCVFKFFSNEHMITFIIFKICFMETKKFSVTQPSRLPRRLAWSLAAFAGIGCSESEVRPQGLTPARPCRDQRFVLP